MLSTPTIKQAVAKAAFWTFGQNNSGGIFDHEPENGIGYAVCVEALDAEDARRRFHTIIASYPASYNCCCCGERWSDYVFEDGGTQEPERYGKPLSGGWGLPSYVHRIDGTIEARTAA